MTNFSYRAYGFGIHSTINIPGLLPSELRPEDISLNLEGGPEPQWVHLALRASGRVASHLPAGERTADPSFILTEYGEGNCCELSYSDGTRFVVNRANDQVWGACQPPLTNEDLATYFLGPVMGFLLRRRQITCLHASAVELHGRAVLFCGDAGYGKSTTAAALALRGIPTISEDILPLELTKGQFWAVPGYPRVCLWPDAVAHLTGVEDGLPRLTPVWDKRYLALDGRRASFVSVKKPIGLIYVFGERIASPRAPSITELRPKDALLELVKNTYMNWLLDRKQRAEEFNVLGNLVQLVPIRQLVAHSDPQKIAQLCELIEQDARKLPVTG